VRESLPFKADNGLEEWHASVVEITTPEPDSISYDIIRECPVEYVFEGDSKGAEGAIHLHDDAGHIYMLALCEGNHCAEGSRGRDKGNGKHSHFMYIRITTEATNYTNLSMHNTAVQVSKVTDYNAHRAIRRTIDVMLHGSCCF
jgi:hypothetical protein